MFDAVLWESDENRKLKPRYLNSSQVNLNKMIKTFTKFPKNHCTRYFSTTLNEGLRFCVLKHFLSSTVIDYRSRSSWISHGKTDSKRYPQFLCNYLKFLKELTILGWYLWFASFSLRIGSLWSRAWSSRGEKNNKRFYSGYNSSIQPSNSIEYLCPGCTEPALQIFWKRSTRILLFGDDII